MNREALQKTRDLLASEVGEKYDQSVWLHLCGSPACVAGFAVAASEGVKVAVSYEESVKDRAQRFLGLTDEEADEMFGFSIYKGYGDPDWKPAREDALRMLDHAIETGEVEWPQ